MHVCQNNDEGLQGLWVDKLLNSIFALLGAMSIYGADEAIRNRPSSPVITEDTSIQTPAAGIKIPCWVDTPKLLNGVVYKV